MIESSREEESLRVEQELKILMISAIELNKKKTMRRRERRCRVDFMKMRKRKKKIKYKRALKIFKMKFLYRRSEVIF